MLALKSSLTYRGVSNQATSGASASITHLPPEILDLILKHLYRASHDRVDSILPVSRASRQLRASTLPLLFESVSCTIREQQGDGRHSSFESVLCQPRLLHHVKTLFLRKPVKIPASTGDIEEHRLRDVAILQTALQLMPQLQKVRFVFPSQQLQFVAYCPRPRRGPHTRWSCPYLPQ
jgi:hypothetical protein